MTEEYEQMTMFDRDTWSGRTFPEPSVPQKAKTSAPSSKKPRGSRTKMPLFLDLRGGKWTTAGCIMGDGWSIAWRVLDAQPLMPTTNRDWLDSLFTVELVDWIKNTASAMSDAELLRWMEEKHETD